MTGSIRQKIINAIQRISVVMLAFVLAFGQASVFAESLGDVINVDVEYVNENGGITKITKPLLGCGDPLVDDSVLFIDISCGDEIYINDFSGWIVMMGSVSMIEVSGDSKVNIVVLEWSGLGALHIKDVDGAVVNIYQQQKDATAPAIIDELVNDGATINLYGVNLEFSPTSPDNASINNANGGSINVFKSTLTLNGGEIINGDLGDASLSSTFTTEDSTVTGQATIENGPGSLVHLEGHSEANTNIINKGTIIVDGDTEIISDEITNEGIFEVEDESTLSAQSINNTNGTIEAKGASVLNVAAINNEGGTLNVAGDSEITATELSGEGTITTDKPENFVASNKSYVFFEPTSQIEILDESGNKLGGLHELTADLKFKIENDNKWYTLTVMLDNQSMTPGEDSFYTISKTDGTTQSVSASRQAVPYEISTVNNNQDWTGTGDIEVSTEIPETLFNQANNNVLIDNTEILDYGLAYDQNGKVLISLKESALANLLDGNHSLELILLNAYRTKPATFNVAHPQVDEPTEDDPTDGPTEDNPTEDNPTDTPTNDQPINDTPSSDTPTKDEETPSSKNESNQTQELPSVPSIIVVTDKVAYAGDVNLSSIVPAVVSRQSDYSISTVAANPVNAVGPLSATAVSTTGEKADFTSTEPVNEEACIHDDVHETNILPNIAYLALAYIAGFSTRITIEKSKK